MKSFFESNLAHLKKIDRGLAERMEARPWPVEGMTLFQARSGAPSLKAVSHDGVEIPLHSEYDPAREAKQFADARKMVRTDAQLLIGFGLGHVAFEVASRLEPHRWFVCMEAHEDIFRAAMEAVDLQPLLGRKNFRVFVGRDWPNFQEWLKILLNVSNTLRLNTVSYPPCHRFFPDFYNSAAAEVDVAIKRHRVETATVMYRGMDMDRNGIRNLPAVAAAHPIRDLQEAFVGYPAAVVAAGPSLTAALPHLLAARDRLVIVTVDAALKPLLAAGVTPDIVTSLDMGPTIMKFYKDLGETPDMMLFFDPDCYYEAPALYKGPLVSFETGNTISRWSKKFFGDLGEVVKGTSVAHTCLQVAVGLGCDPLILVGLDLSYPGQKTHAEGVPISADLDPKTKKYIHIPGVQGKPVLATDGFQSFVTVFEVLISKIKQKVIQSSEVGALIRGAENVPLPVAIERHAERKIPIEEVREKIQQKPSHFDAEAFREEADATVKGMEQVLEVAETGLKLVRQLRRLNPANKLEFPEMKKKFTKARDLEKVVVEDPRLILLFSRTLTTAAHHLRVLQVDLDGLKDGDPERARNVIKQYDAIFTGYKEGAEFFLEEFRPVRERLLKEFGRAGD